MELETLNEEGKRRYVAILEDTDALNGAVSNLCKDDWELLVKMLGELARLTDGAEWTPAMQEELQSVGEQLGAHVRYAANLRAQEDDHV